MEIRMAIYELWIECSEDRKYYARYDRLPPEKGDSSFSTKALNTQLEAAQELRAYMRKVAVPGDYFRVRGRTNIYEHINDALEDILRQ
jgi:hypothetical protein